jgi:hypothetical protein
MIYSLKCLLSSADISLYANNIPIIDYELGANNIGVIEFKFKPKYNFIENTNTIENTYNYIFYEIINHKIYTNCQVLFVPNPNSFYLIYVCEFNKPIHILKNKTLILQNINNYNSYIGLFNDKLQLIQEYSSNTSDIYFYCLTHTTLDINITKYNELFKYNNTRDYILETFNILFHNIDTVYINKDKTQLKQIENINLINIHKINTNMLKIITKAILAMV